MPPHQAKGHLPSEPSSGWGYRPLSPTAQETVLLTVLPHPHHEAEQARCGELLDGLCHMHCCPPAPCLGWLGCSLGGHRLSPATGSGKLQHLVTHTHPAWMQLHHGTPQRPPGELQARHMWQDSQDPEQLLGGAVRLFSMLPFPTQPSTSPTVQTGQSLQQKRLFSQLRGRAMFTQWRHFAPLHSGPAFPAATLMAVST